MTAAAITPFTLAADDGAHIIAYRSAPAGRPRQRTGSQASGPPATRWI